MPTLASSQYIQRSESVFNGSKNLEPLYTFKNFPVFFGCTDQEKGLDIHADMAWAIDKDSGVIQLTKLIPLDILYSEQHVDGVGPTWESYYQALADLTVKHKPRNILEIGGGSGRLAELIKSKCPEANYVMMEPNPELASNNFRVIRNFFSKDTILEDQYDTIVFSQVLEHVYFPRDFIEGISKNLKTGGRLIFGYPHLEYMLSHMYTNALNFEHTMMYTDNHIDHNLGQNKLKIVEKIIHNKVNFLYVCIKQDKIIEYPFNNKYLSYKKIFNNFIEHQRIIINDLNKRIAKTKVPIYLFGAHIFSQFLIEMGLNTKKIISILDNGVSKQNRRLYGTNLISRNPSILKDIGKAAVILKAGSYNSEIKQDIIQNINSKIIFLE